MRKFIRNDYTFIKRLERIGQKYLKQEQNSSVSSYLGSQGLRMYLHTGDWVKNIKEDMKLNALQKINDSGERNKEYKCIFNK